MDLETSRRRFLTAACASAIVARTGGGVRLALAGESDMADAAVQAGFRVLPRRDLADTLADPSVEAMCVDTAAMAIDACKAGKDVWVKAPVRGDIAEGRRLVAVAREYGRVVQAGTTWRSSKPFQEARRAVRAGQLGKIVFCRAFEGTECARPARLLDLLQSVFDEAVPLSISAQGSGGNLLATLRYPGFVASYERPGAGEAGIAFHGVRATLVVHPQRESGAALAAHWRNFLECIRSRRRPVSDIETAVRSALTQLRMEA